MTTEIAWWQDAKVRVALGAMSAGIVALLHFFCETFHVLCVSVTESQLTMALLSVAGVAGGGALLWKRLRAGNDPDDPAKRVTLTDTKI